MMPQKKNTRPTREQRRAQRREDFTAIRRQAKDHPGMTAVYFVLRLLVLAVMVLQAIKGDYYNVLLCALTLVLFLIPTFVEHRLHIDVPNALEVIILLFIFAAEILGEIQEYYLIFPFWDTMLHTMNGFLMAAIGVAMVDILNRSRKFRVRLSPAFVALLAFCFSMTTGVVWEFFEYGMDTFFHTDMQKDTWITAFSTVSLNPSGANVPVEVAVDSVQVNGQAWPAYLDIGLHDTMADLLVNFLGAVTFSLLGLGYLKGRGRFKSLFQGLIPRLKKEELSSAPAQEPGLLDPVSLSGEQDAAPQEDCPFCQIVLGKAPCYKLYEDEYTLAFLDIAGDAEGHTLVIPKTHVENLLDCGEETALQVAGTVRLLTEHFVKHCGYDGVDLLGANGKSAGQSVGHLHIHLIPRREGDGLQAWPKLGRSLTPLEQVQRRLALTPPAAPEQTAERKEGS